jgi:hypothetical protein
MCYNPPPLDQWKLEERIMCYNPPPLDQWESDILDNAVQKSVTFFGMSTINFFPCTMPTGTCWASEVIFKKKDGSFYSLKSSRGRALLDFGQYLAPPHEAHIPVTPIPSRFTLHALSKYGDFWGFFCIKNYFVYPWLWILSWFIIILVIILFFCSGLNFLPK